MASRIGELCIYRLSWLPSYYIFHNLCAYSPLNQTLSWETTAIAPSGQPSSGLPQRTMSCDQSGDALPSFTLGASIAVAHHQIASDQLHHQQQQQQLQSQQHRLDAGGTTAQTAQTTTATTAAGISSSSSEHDNHETGTWSSDYSNSEDECSQIGSGIANAAAGNGDNAILVSIVGWLLIVFLIRCVASSVRSHI